MSNLQEPFEFKFKWLNDQGQETGFRSKRGQFDGEMLVLDDVTIPALAIAQVQTRERIMVILVVDGDGNPIQAAFGANPGDLARLKAALDASRSSAWARHHREQLQKEGRGHAYRDEDCPNCGATVVLSDMPRTPQLYCPYCDTLMTADPAHDPPPGERDLRICGECQMFSRPQKYTVLYIWFVLVAYGWHSYPTWRCPACMRGTAWKMFFGNLLFLIGTPVALVQLARTYGGSIRGPFAGLDRANLKARSGDALGALEGYRAILERIPCSAGLKYNLGLALLQQKDKPRAAEAFRVALNDCANYAPAYQQLAACWQELGETEKLAELNRMWGVSQSGEQEAEAEASPIFE